MRGRRSEPALLAAETAVTRPGSGLPRTVSPETLDDLAAQDPRARRSRRDLRRVNRIMGTSPILTRALQGERAAERPMRVLELGAGDGIVMLRVAQRLVASWPSVELTLLDRLALVEAPTLAAYARFGWTVHNLQLDVLEWAATPLPSAPWDVIVTNLFLHHFTQAQLPGLLEAIAQRCRVFIACEPRRAMLPLIGAHLMGAIGASALTRHDAVLSVHAGFRERELSILWPREPGRWRLQERHAGAFSHLFCAARNAGVPFGAAGAAGAAAGGAP